MMNAKQMKKTELLKKIGEFSGRQFTFNELASMHGGDVKIIRRHMNEMAKGKLVFHMVNSRDMNRDAWCQFKKPIPNPTQFASDVRFTRFGVRWPGEV